MPDIRVQDEQGTIHVFPDEATPEMIAKAMNVKPPAGQFQPPDANAQAKAVFSQPGLSPQFTSPTDALRANLSNAQEGVGPVGKQYNEYQRQSGQQIGTIAAGMATGGMFPAIKGAGVLKNILPFLARTGTSAAAMGAGTLAGGGTPQEAKGAAVGGAVGQPISEGIGAAVPWAASKLKGSAVGQYARALSPTTRLNKVITKKIAPEMIDRGISGSLENIEEQAGTQAAALKPQLDAAYQATPAAATVGSGRQIVQDLENLKGKYTVQGMPANPAAVNAISGVQDVVKQYGDDIAPDSLRKLKQIFDEPVAARGGYAGGDLTTAYTLKAEKAAGNSIRSIMGKANPDVDALGKEVNFWLNVRRVTSQSDLRRTGQEGGLIRAIGLPFLTAGGGMAGHAMGGTAATLEGAAAGLLATAATMAVRSPAWRTASAVFKSRFADALARGSVSEVAALSAKVGVTNLGAQTSRLPWNQTQPPQGQASRPQ